MKHEYLIDEKERLIFQSFKGQYSFRDFETVVLKLTSDKRFSPDYNILTDIRECEIQFQPDDIMRFFQTFKDKVGESKGKTAIIVNAPKETAISTIHQKAVSDIREIQVFSNREAAMDWLKGSS